MSTRFPLPENLLDSRVHTAEAHDNASTDAAMAGIKEVNNQTNIMESVTLHFFHSELSLSAGSSIIPRTYPVRPFVFRIRKARLDQLR
jgi:hypothetical protein